MTIERGRIMFKKILFCIAVITCPALDLKAGEVTLREPEQVVTPIITHDERLILGASFSHTKYQDFSFGEVEFKEVFDRMDDSEWKKHPEYVLYRTYQYLREGKAEDLYSIWDPVYSRETISGGVEGLQERVSRENEFVEYGEVELTGKARFGPFVRLDHEVVMRTPQGQLSRATAFYYIQHDKRFFQTKLVGRTHLFGIIVDLAIQGEQEHHVALDDQFEEANELKITVDDLPP